ncbi:hypothetical protein OJAV_G00195740 [Oryzias javanicus]|uniref:Rho GTPase-activating protein 21 n=1 Tax=Oryzias javanicus TaxID=123683 RepID=A0A3S2MGD0_ORYJA|nr:hypothetical protein OJAV_G00195740 [Oryzias javanicus]
MLAQRNGLPPGCKEAPPKDPSDLWDVDVGAEGCCSFSSSLSSGGCPWARLAGVDGCSSEPYCLWFQLLARAYCGEVELGINSTNRSVSWARLREASRKSFFRSRAKQKDGRDQSEASAAASPGPEEEPFSWPGPKTLRLRRTSQGFGFTLRHFIVYPPESAVHNSLKDDENGSRGRQRNRLEPMDTIFVKQVKEGGPAHGAGLCTGDRIVKVNGESIIGKTYSQVIALIQNSDASLELCVMPKDEDILQLAYSQDAYLKGNEAYSGNAQNIPEPPPICYPRIELKTAGPAQTSEPGRRGGAAEKSCRMETPVSPSPLQAAARVCGENDPVDRGSRLARAGPSHRTEENRFGVPAASASNPDTLAPPARDAISPNRCSPSPSSPHQHIDWRNYTTYKDYIDAKRLHSYGCRTIQERLDSLRAAADPAYSQQRTPPPCSSQRGAQVKRRSVSNDRGGDAACAGAASLRSASQERLVGGAERADRNWPRSASQDALPFSPAVRVLKPRARSCDYLNQPPAEERAETSPAPETEGLILRPSRLPVKTSDASPAKTADPLKDQRVAGNHLDYSPPLHLQLRSRADSLKTENRAESGLAARSSSCSGASSKPLRQPHIGVVTVSSRIPPTNGAQKPASGSAQALFRTNHGSADGVEGPDAAVVVLRKDRNFGSARPRPPSYVFAVNDSKEEAAYKAPPLVKAGSADGAVCWMSAESCRDLHLRGLGENRHKSGSTNLDNSLDSIPFIDEPSSPSLDLDSVHIPASVVICGTPAITTIPPSPTSSSPLIRRQLSHDQDSFRLTIVESDSGSKTERSKSYDEGLDNYQDGRGRSLIPGLKGLRKAIDRSSEDSGSRGDSSSDVFCDATKEGFLHFKQLHTDKGKRVGGGMRPWKQVYAVLRGHGLCLYKDRKEGQAHASCQAAEEPLQVSIKACLIDISYSDTKRKNVLRLTTSDCEYLFQAEDREDMLAWIRVIQENSHLDEESAVFSSHDLISRKIKEYNTLMSPTGSKSEPSPRTSRQSLSIRQTLLGGKGDGKTPSPQSPKADVEKRSMLKDDTSPPKDKGTWRKGIPGLMRKPFEKKPSAGVTFGVRLDDCPPAQTNKFVPLIVEVCCKLVEERGLEYTGIYRVPGNNAAISNMQEELNNKGVSDIDVQDDKWKDLNVISSLLKSFFRKLPEPLFTNRRYADFIEANRIEDPVERLKVLKRLLHELPDHHYETLKFLSAHLKTVAENSEKNKMEPRNLAIVFGPTLVRTTEDNMTHMVTHMPDQYRIVETLIQNYDWFFTDDGNGDPVTVSREESAVESQPVPNIDHLLTNIGRTGASQGEVSGQVGGVYHAVMSLMDSIMSVMGSWNCWCGCFCLNASPLSLLTVLHAGRPERRHDSPASDSAKSKGSWGSGRDPVSRELLVSSIFAAASRKRKKSKEKAQPSSSDDDPDPAFAALRSSQAEAAPGGGREAAGAPELASKAKREHRNSLFIKETPPKQPSPNASSRAARQGRSSLSDPPSQPDENTSDLGTMSSGASVPRSRPKKWTGGGSPDLLVNLGASARAEVSSITSDYSTTSSNTFLTGAESSALSPELQPGEDADDERSELVSEGRPMETDSESDFPVFSAAQSTPHPEPDRKELRGAAAAPKLEARRLFPSQRMIEGDTLSRRWSLRQKTDSDSSAEGAAGGEARPESSTRLSRVLEVMKKGRSSSSISSSSRSESERAEPAWHLKITERLKLRLRSSADDMLAPRSRPAEARGKKRSIRRRHTMGGQRDFAELAVIHDWREQGGGDGAADLSALDRLKPRCSSQDFSIRDWIARERCRGPEPGAAVAPKAVPEDDPAEAQGAAPAGEQVNGAAPQNKNKPSAGTDPHPHKLSGAQVVRSRFYQYL